jgi:hypothetical protein
MPCEGLQIRSVSVRIRSDSVWYPCDHDRTDTERIPIPLFGIRSYPLGIRAIMIARMPNGFGIRSVSVRYPFGIRSPYLNFP